MGISLVWTGSVRFLCFAFRQVSQTLCSIADMEGQYIWILLATLWEGWLSHPKFGTITQQYSQTSSMNTTANM